MKKLSALACTVVIALILFTELNAQTVVPFYIIIGQSNTGWASTNNMNAQQAALYKGLIPNTNIWNPGVGSYAAVWQPMNVGINTRCENYVDSTQFGPEASLLRNLQTLQGKKRFVYKQGQGGTTLATDWKPQQGSQPLYLAGSRWQQFAAWLPAAVAQANTQGYKLDLRAVIWMQGEDDSKTLADATAYLDNLGKFFKAIDKLWKDMILSYGLPNTAYKTVIGRIYAPTTYAYRDMVRTAQADYCSNASNNAVLINTDGYPLQDWVHYNATGQIQFGADIFNAVSYEALAVPVVVSFAGKVLLQGAYNTSTGIMSNTLNTSGLLKSYALGQPYNNITFNYAGTESVSSTFFASKPEIIDWIIIELRSAASPATVIARRAAFVLSNGTLADTDGVSSQVAFPGVTAGSYYVVIKHRNHLAIRSSQTVDFSSGPGNYDFTSSSGKAYQNLAYSSTVQMGNVWVMRAGNANLNNNVKYNGPLNDQDRIQNIALSGSLANVLNGMYSNDDINMDGSVRTNGPGNDQNFLLNFIFGGVISNVFIEQL